MPFPIHYVNEGTYILRCGTACRLCLNPEQEHPLVSDILPRIGTEYLAPASLPSLPSN